MKKIAETRLNEIVLAGETNCTFLYARLQTGRIMVWWCPSVRPSVRPFSALFSYMLWHNELKFCTWLCFNVLQIKFECRHFASIFIRPSGRIMVWWCPSVRVSVRPFSALFSYMLWHIELKFCTWLCSNVLQIKFECRQFASSFVGVMPLLEFSALFSYMLWHIELKFCTWLCSNLLQIKFECRQFASSFVGVMPLLELRILEIHSFPHFSLTCFDILSWNFAYDFVLLYYRSSSSVVNFHQFLWELFPFWNLNYWKYSFPHFLLHALTYWAEILHITLF